MRQTKLFTIALLSLVIISGAQAQLSIDGEFRTRGIAENGFKVASVENGDSRYSFDQRTRLRLNYKTDKYSTRLSLQDARVWGSDDMMSKTGPQGNSSSLGVYEAWVDLKLSAQSNLKVGRQEWHYNDMRILSNRNFWTSGLSYDGLLFKWHNSSNNLKLDIGASYNNDGAPIGIFVDNSAWNSDKIKTMNFINLHKDFGEKTSLALMMTLSGKVDPAKDAVLGTGTHGLVFTHNQSSKKTDGLFGGASAYYQHGTDVKRGTDGNYKDISAYLLAANVGVRLLDKKLELSAGMELLSGHDYTNTDEDYNNTRHSFDLQYSGRMPYYSGYMNQFVIQDSYLVGTKGGAYFDPYFKAKYHLNKKNIIEAGVFMPMLASKVRAHTGIDAETGKPTGAEFDANGNPVYWEGSLGQFVDVLYTHKVSKEVIFKGGLSIGGISDIKNQMSYGYKDVATKELYQADTNYFAWVMLIVKPKFL